MASVGLTLIYIYIATTLYNFIVNGIINIKVVHDIKKEYVSFSKIIPILYESFILVPVLNTISIFSKLFYYNNYKEKIVSVLLEEEYIVSIDDYIKEIEEDFNNLTLDKEIEDNNIIKKSFNENGKEENFNVNTKEKSKIKIKKKK